MKKTKEEIREEKLNRIGNWLTLYIGIISAIALTIACFALIKLLLI